MDCNVSEEQLRSWIDRRAPELDDHLAICPECRARVAALRAEIETVANDQAEHRPLLPERIGSYVIKRLLGEGGMGVVYEAEQQAPRRTVALKVLRGGLGLNEHQIKLFQREIEALARLDHPAIAAIYEAGQTATGQHFFAMELVRGVSLSEYVRREKLSLEQRLELFHKICEAIDYAHQHDVIHRDIKPSNIFIVAESPIPNLQSAIVKILDFGLARITDPNATLFTTVAGSGELGGTLPYISPEQARCDPDEVDTRSDIYSLGVTLYELLTDHLPYDLRRTPLPEAVRVICEKAPERPSSIDRTLRGDVETIVLKALEKEPARRYQSVKELADDVRRHLDGEPIRARPPSGFYILRKKLTKYRFQVAVGAAAVIVVLLVLWGQGWSRAQERARKLAGARQGVLRIQRNLEMGNVKRSIGPARATLSQYPELPEAHLVWVQAQFRAGRELEDQVLYGDATHSLRAAARVPAPWASRALMAELYRFRGDPRFRQLEAGLKDDIPDTAEASYLLSFATLDLHKALACAEQAVKRDPRHELAWQRLAYLHMQTGDCDAAQLAARKLIELECSRDEWIMFGAHVLLRRGRYQEAVTQYTLLADTLPDPTSIYRYRGLAHICLKQHTEAIRDLSKYIESGMEKDDWMYYQRATPLWISGQVEKAAADYRRTLQLRNYASFADVRLFLVLCEQARCLEREGRHAEIRDIEEEAREVLAGGLRGATSRSWLENILHCLDGRLAPSELPRFADRSNPEQVCEAYYYTGEAYLLAGQIEAARDCFQKCVDTNLVFDRDTFPPDPMNEYHLAVWRLDNVDDNTATLPENP